MKGINRSNCKKHKKIKNFKFSYAWKKETLLSTISTSYYFYKSVKNSEAILKRKNLLNQSMIKMSKTY